MYEDSVETVIHSAMERNGWIEVDSMQPFDKVLELDPAFRFRRFEREDEIILLTDGCRRVRRVTHDWDEYFLPATDAEQEFFLELLNYIAFFHLTLRPLNVAKCYSMGSSFENLAPFSDLLVVAPYFLTETTYPIMDGANRIYLSLCLPISASEKEWVTNRDFHGVDGALWEYRTSFFANTHRPTFL